jgi:hypothetical protein
MHRHADYRSVNTMCFIQAEPKRTSAVQRGGGGTRGRRDALRCRFFETMAAFSASGRGKQHSSRQGRFSASQSHPAKKPTLERRRDAGAAGRGGGGTRGRRDAGAAGRGGGGARRGAKGRSALRPYNAGGAARRDAGAAGRGGGGARRDAGAAGRGGGGARRDAEALGAAQLSAISS